MANKKVSELGSAASLNGAELLELIQSGNNVKALLSVLVPAEYSFVDDSSGARTLALTDQSKPWAPKILRMQHATANNVTVPPNSTVPIPVGAQVNVMHDGAGTLTFVEGSGVTVREPPGGTLDSAGEGAMFVLIKRATDTWQLIGATAEAPP